MVKPGPNIGLVSQVTAQMFCDEHCDVLQVGPVTILPNLTSPNNANQTPTGSYGHYLPHHALLVIPSLRHLRGRGITR
jgi:hypothetical protein